MLSIFEILKDIKELLVVQQRELTDEEALEIIENYIFNKEELFSLQITEKGDLIKRVFHELRKDLGILDIYQQDPSISEIMVNGKDHIFIEKGGEIFKLEDRFESIESLEEVIRRLLGKVHRDINELNPIADARLLDGSRINAVYKNVAINGPILTIRKFPEKRINMEKLIQNKTIPKEAADFLIERVLEGYNILISGGTASGKTTFLNVLSQYIPGGERVIVIEDSAELQMPNLENLVRLECRNANLQGKGEITMAQLIKTSLRMRPDRIIVGEIRGKEVLDMIQAMNTGHDGSLCTGHGNSVKGMLRRLEAMFLQAADFPIEAIRSQIAEAVDIIIHLGRFDKGVRKVLEISELMPYRGDDIEINTIYHYVHHKGLVATGEKLVREKMCL